MTADSTRPRVGLVLGGGGIVGQAYHAGVLAALHEKLGWDPRTADIIVGSSAGSLTGTLLRLGVPASDLVAWATDAPLSVEGATILDGLESRPRFPRPAPLDLLRPWRPPSAALMTRTMLRPWEFRPGLAAMTMMPRGRLNILERAAVFNELARDEWPEGLWICAARASDGGRVVFGRPGSPEAPLAHAVAASCAIPGYFAPVRIHGVDYFDGGAFSANNADALRKERLDVVIVVSPMSSVRGTSRGLDAMFRRMTHRLLGREIAVLRESGATVVRFEPGRQVLPAWGLNGMSVSRSAEIVKRSFEEATRVLAHPTTAARLADVAA